MTTFLRIPFNEKKHYPMSGKNRWIVQKVRQATLNRGSQILSHKTFRTKREAWTYIHEVQEKIAQKRRKQKLKNSINGYDLGLGNVKGEVNKIISREFND